MLKSFKCSAFTFHESKIQNSERQSYRKKLEIWLLWSNISWANCNTLLWNNLTLLKTSVDFLPYLNQLRLGNGVAFQSKIDENTIRLTHLFVLCPFVARNARKLKSEICLTPKYNFQKRTAMSLMKSKKHPTWLN